MVIFDDISKAYANYYSKGKEGMRKRINAVSVIIAIDFLIKKWGKKDMENCSGKPGVVYNFDNQDLISY